MEAHADAKAVKVDVTPLVRLTKAERQRAEQAWRPYADFLARELAVQWG